MKKLTIYPFFLSASLFGTTALITVLAQTIISGENPTKTDDPYIIAFAFSSFISLAGLIFFTLKEIELKWLKPIPSLLSYYLVLIILSLYTEYIGGEGAGFGYFFITCIALLSTILLLYIIYSKNRKLLYIGLIGAIVYFIGYAIGYTSCCA